MLTKINELTNSGAKKTHASFITGVKRSRSQASARSFLLQAFCQLDGPARGGHIFIVDFRTHNHFWSAKNHQILFHFIFPHFLISDI